MITRHFLKTLITFTAMIAIALLGIFLVSYLDKSGVEDADDTANNEEVIAN